MCYLTKIFIGNNFRELVPSHEKHENLHPAKLTGYVVFGTWVHSGINQLHLASNL